MNILTYRYIITFGRHYGVIIYLKKKRKKETEL